MIFSTKETMQRGSGDPGTGRPTPPAGVTIPALACAAALSLTVLYLNRAFYHDDAYITLRYARNLINGNGVVWNPGEYVQGYTNFLHLALIALLGRFGVDLVLASRLIGLAAFAGLLGVLGVFFKYSFSNERARALWHLPLILTATSAPLLVWSLGGLEGTLLSLLVTAGILFFLESMKASTGWRLQAASGVCFGLGFLTRPDGLIFPFVAGIWLLATVRTRARLQLLVFAASVAIIIGPYCIWQLLYYGDLVPNTFYAKTGSLSLHSLSTGLRYVAGYAVRPPYLPVLACASLVYAAIVRAWNAKLTYLVLSVTAYAAFVIFVGGDHMQAYRLLVPLVAPMSLLFWMPLTAFAGTQRRIWVLTCVILILSSLQVLSGNLNPRTEDPAAFVGTVVGNYIAQKWPAGSLVALNTAGSTPYYADHHRYIDMLGLNDSHIAKRREVKNTALPWWGRIPGHLKGDGAYVLSRQPDFIIIGPAEGTNAENPWFVSDLEISIDPRFSQSYVYREVELPRVIKPFRKKKSSFVYYQRIHEQGDVAEDQHETEGDKR